MRQRLFALSLLLALAATTPAREVTVAVMPFQDLSGASSAVGEAIRESVTANLRGLPGVRVVERSEINRVLEEQALTAKDPGESAPQVGRLMGADHLAVGAFQKIGGRIRLTARMVDVATGEVVVAAKVDGAASKFLALQDQLTSELLKGLKQRPAASRLEAPPPPELEDLRSVELFGRALQAKSDDEMHALLCASVREEPRNHYPARELAALEARMKVYRSRAVAAELARVEQLRREYRDAVGEESRRIRRWALASALTVGRRYNELARLWSAEAARDGGPAADEAIRQEARAQLLGALVLLRKTDQAMHEAERYLADYPASPWFSSVQATLSRLLEERLEAERRRPTAEGSVRALSSELRWDLCRLGQVYAGAKRAREAERLFSACLETGAGDPAVALTGLAEGAMDTGRWGEARRHLSRLERDFPESYARLQGAFEARLPADDE